MYVAETYLNISVLRTRDAIRSPLTISRSVAFTAVQPGGTEIKTIHYQAPESEQGSAGLARATRELE